MASVDQWLCVVDGVAGISAIDENNLDTCSGCVSLLSDSGNTAKLYMKYSTTVFASRN